MKTNFIVDSSFGFKNIRKCKKNFLENIYIYKNANLDFVVLVFQAAVSMLKNIKRKEEKEKRIAAHSHCLEQRMCT